jgi:hypothetical protein
MTWKFRLKEPHECDVALIQRVRVRGLKTGSAQADVSYWEVVGIIRAGQVDGPNIDTWFYSGESDSDISQRYHATLNIKGRVYAYELTSTLDDVLKSWERNRTYPWGATTWAAGRFPSNSTFFYKDTEDAKLIEEEETTTILKVEFRMRTGNVITTSTSENW